MQVLTAAEMRNCDRITVERYGVSSLELMRTAAAAVADFALSYYSRLERVTVLCGRGNNGGDGMIAAHLLTLAGVRVTTLLLGDPAGLKGDAAIAWKLLNTGDHGPIHIIQDADTLITLAGGLETDLLIDAVVGTGFAPPLRGLALAALDWVQSCNAPVLAVDLPSGWPADLQQSKPEHPVYPADAIVTFTAPKPAHLFGQMTRYADQPVIVAAIGSPAGAITEALASDGASNTPGIHWTGAAHALVSARRPTESNKGSFGHVLVLGGSFGSVGGKAGAPAMAGLAAMRGGAGLVTVAVPAPALPLVAAVAPEMMTAPLLATAVGCIAAKNAETECLSGVLEKKTVVVVGPGMGTEPETAKFFQALLEAVRVPMVIDADGLNLLAERQVLLARASELAKQGRLLVITPHPGEMARLVQISVAEVQANRVEVARDFARRAGVVVVLKGVHTIVAYPEGRVAVNTSGNPGLAKGGSGDVLAGLIGALLAQFPKNPQQAIEGAIYLHGRAADFAARRLDEHAMLATDVIADFSSAFRSSVRDENGYLWLQGMPTQGGMSSTHSQTEPRA